MGLDETLKRLRNLCEEAGSMRKWAKAKGFHVSYISQVLSGKSPPSERLIKKMGGEKQYIFPKKMKFD